MFLEFLLIYVSGCDKPQRFGCFLSVFLPTVCWECVYKEGLYAKSVPRKWENARVGMVY